MRTSFYLIYIFVFLFACKQKEQPLQQLVDPVTPDIGATLGEEKFGKHMRGIPDIMLPETMTPQESKGEEKYSVVRNGARDLKVRPFDYRSPFTLKDPNEDIYEFKSQENNKWIWPFVDQKSKPFNYYLNDKVAIGRLGGPESAVVDAFGTLRALTGAFSIVENDGSLFDLRIRTLEEGNLPIVKAEVLKEGSNYHFEYFGATITGAPVVSYPRSFHNFGEEGVRGENFFLSTSCEFENLEQKNKTVELKLGYDERSMLAAGASYSYPDYNKAWDKVYLKKGETNFYRVIGEREGVLFTIALINTSMQLTESDSELSHWPLTRNPTMPKKGDVQFPDQPKHLTINATQEISKGESGKLSLLIPMFPLQESNDSFLVAQDLSSLKNKTKKEWKRRRNDFFELSLPEDKVENTFYTAINNLELCMISNGTYKYPTPGPSGGHHIFYGRDVGDMIYAYDLMGDHKTAEEMLNIFHLKGGGREAGSIYIWAMERHFAITRDTEWLKANFSIIEGLMNSLIATWNDQQDPVSGIFKARKLHDNEYIADSYVGTHLYLASSAKRAVKCAEIVGNNAMAKKWETFYQTFSTNVRKALENTCSKTGGVITPGFAGYDAPSFDTINLPFAHYGKGGGCDWHNLGALYPTGFVKPNDPINQSSYRRWVHCYLEGIFPYARRQGNYTHLHNYNVMNLSESFLRDGMYAEALRDLYGVLLHTSSTHAAAEQIFSRSRVDHGTTPHNWFSAKYISFVRDMLVYEDENEGKLNLLAGMSPEWMQPGEKIEVKDTPTTLGKISMTAEMQERGLELKIDLKAYPDTKGMVLHFPPFVTVDHLIADGKPIDSDGTNHFDLPLNTKQVSVQWSGYPWPSISYNEVVNSYIQDYNNRVVQFKTLTK